MSTHTTTTCYCNPPREWTWASASDRESAGGNLCDSPWSIADGTKSELRKSRDFPKRLVYLHVCPDCYAVLSVGVYEEELGTYADYLNSYDFGL